MNLNMHSVNIISEVGNSVIEANESQKLSFCHVRGTNVKYVRIPDEVAFCFLDIRYGFG